VKKKEKIIIIIKRNNNYLSNNDKDSNAILSCVIYTFWKVIILLKIIKINDFINIEL
jgi:hypothetical protein